jgi:hypothetical protein
MDFNVTSTLQAFLEAHSVSTQVDGQRVIAGNMSASALVFRKTSAKIENLLQLDINVKSPLIGNRTLIESFAGWGSDEQHAIKKAWEKFSTSSLHVILEVFVNNQRAGDTVDWEIWRNNNNSWRACIGPLSIVGFDEESPPRPICGNLIDQLRDALLPQATRECHWLRFYYMKKESSRVGSECLLDNVPWQEGQDLVDQWNWPDGNYSVRLFLILLPEAQ